jgi:hypothetical protein
MRSLVVIVLLTVGCGFEDVSIAAEQQDVPAVTIRIFDYARIPNELVTRAQHLVSDVYGDIGVQTDWAETIRSTEPWRDDEAHVIDSKELLVIILSPDMSSRKMVATDVVGTAAVTIREGGRVAYVLFDRVCTVAARSARNTMDVMGLVIAHELAHLLLPYGSHSESGLMRAQWSVEELRSASRELFEFTRAQGVVIREMLSGRSKRAADTHCVDRDTRILQAEQLPSGTC